MAEDTVPTQADASRPERSAIRYADPDLERLIVGGLACADPGALGELPRLQRDDLVDPARGEILEVIRDHVARGWPIELPALQTTLRERGWPHIAHELAEAWDSWSLWDAQHTAHYAARLRMLSRMRTLRRVLVLAWATLDDAGLGIEERLQAVTERLPQALAAAQAAAAELQGGGCAAA